MASPVKVCYLAPVEAEAVQVRPPFNKVAEWCNGTLLRDGGRIVAVYVPDVMNYRKTCELGDWVVKMNGDLYGYSDDEFRTKFRLGRLPIRL